MTDTESILKPDLRLRKQIRKVFADRVVNYFSEHTEWLLDERSKLGIESTLVLLENVLQLLDNYEIEDKVKKPK